MPLFFILLLVSYLLGNIYIFVRGLQALGQISFIFKWGYGLSYWAGAFMLFAIFALRSSRQIPFSIGQVLFHIGSGWLVFTLYMVIFLSITDLVKVFNSSFQYGFVISLLLTSGLLVYGYIRYQHPEKQVFNIHINKPLINKDRLKIVAISDWHLGLGTGIKKLKKDVDRINAENPDLIIIGGDLIDNSIIPVIDRQMDRELNRLHATMGIYMAPGNHEYISGIGACTDFINKTQIKLLKDSIVTLPCGLQIIGRDDRQNRNRLSVRDLTRLTDKSRPVVLIDHQPVELAATEATGVVDIQFSGHTHNGQVFPLSLLAGYLFDISYGYEKRGNTNFYVSSGFSLWGPPFRIGTCSEFVIFECSFIE
ncbi:MAG: metallophosphoesterase [Tannerella sp.]|jgi:predicted MPP superfamily phosphohydrolase|nr:metallophosphoesterase [Tannerella sp.]